MGEAGIKDKPKPETWYTKVTGFSSGIPKAAKECCGGISLAVEMQSSLCLAHSGDLIRLCGSVGTADGGCHFECCKMRSALQ